MRVYEFGGFRERKSIRLMDLLRGLIVKDSRVRLGARGFPMEERETREIERRERKQASFR